MGEELTPGACKNEIKGLTDSATAVRQAKLALDSARHNMQAGGITAGGAGVAMIGCTLMTAGLGAGVCLVGTGLAVIGSLLWTESAAEAMIPAEAQAEAVLASAEAAIAAACKCFAENTVSVPD